MVLRVRPILTNERKYGDASCIEVVDGAKRKVQVKVHPSKIDYFKCCRCFARDTQQAQLFSECGLTNLIDVAMKGNVISIFSYGETGSGKTFTLFGTPKVFGTKEKKSGLILRTLRYLFTKLRENDIKVQVQLSSVEILNEQVFDLFVSESDRSPLVVHEDENAIITLSKLTLCNCFDYSSASETLEKIVLNRCSPRQRDSHCLTEIHISIPSTTESGNVSCVPLSKISFVDLMGSELFHANQQREGNDLVDNSLYVVSKVIDGIEHEDNNNTRVTDSVLTTLLSRSIGVRGRSLLVACVCEAKLNVEETIRTLKFR